MSFWNCAIRSAVSSYETPIMLRPLLSRSFCIALNDGISDRQGIHQVAQKFSSTTLPCRSLSRNGWPSSLVNCTSGAAVKVWLAGGGGGVSPPRNFTNRSNDGNQAARRELDKRVTRLLITSPPIKIRMMPETTSTLCKCWRNLL